MLLALHSAALVACALAAPATRLSPALLFQPRGPSVLVPDLYIVKLYDHCSPTQSGGIIESLRLEPDHIYADSGFPGFLVRLNATGLGFVQGHPDVEFVEQDARVTAAAYNEQAGAPWGLRAVSHRSVDDHVYTYHSSAGADTCSYVLDTGIYENNLDFGERAFQLVGFLGGPSVLDPNGHGTHVAGTIGGAIYGLAKKTQLLGIQVLDERGTGSISSVLKGIDFVKTDVRSRACSRGAIAVMAFSGPRSIALNAATAALVREGVFVAAAAGNQGIDAAQTSPASEPSACTAGGVDYSGSVASYSNWGSSVDIYAPASVIESAWTDHPNATSLASGTSMASAHVAGLAAYLNSLEGPLKPNVLCQRIRELARHDAVRGLPLDSPGLLIFNGYPHRAANSR